jgi:TolB-like protein/tetratricopeptide (TPR) repeat protein
MKSLFTELRRRKVFTVAAGYIVIGWLLVEVAATLFPIFDAPDWVLKVVTTLVFLGFPVALVLAWAYELTPDGIAREKKGDEVLPAASNAAAPDAASDASPESIAVLPFVSMSPHVDDEHLADGIAEEIINALAQIPGLKVAARTSAFSFKGNNTDLKEIGAALGVGRVLEGSLRRAGEQLRVTAQLINVADGFHLWSERYDRELVDIFAIQDEIAQAIAGRIGGDGPGRVASVEARRFTENMKAYELYLKGKLCWARSGEFFLKGIEYVDEARRLDPNFAQAHAWYAVMQVYLVFFGYAKGTDQIDLAVDAADRALACNDHLAESQIAYGIVRQYFFYDWAATEKHYLRALELMPGDAVASAWYSIFLTRFPDRHEQSLEYARRAVSLDPLSADHNAILVWILWDLGQTEEASELLESIKSMHPVYLLSYSFSGAIRSTQGRHDEAIALVESAPEMAKNDPMYLAFSAFSLGKAGRLDEARALVAQAEEQRAESYFGPSFLSIAHLGLGHVDQALTWAETAVDELDGFITYAGTLPVFSELWAEPRFQAVLERMNLTRPS